MGMIHFTTVLKPPGMIILQARSHAFAWLGGGGDFLGSKGIVFFWIIQNHTWIFQVCKIYAFSPKKNLPKGRHLTYLEDAGMEDYTLENSYFEPQKKELDGRWFSDFQLGGFLKVPAVNFQGCRDPFFWDTCFVKNLIWDLHFHHGFSSDFCVRQIRLLFHIGFSFP